MTGVSYVNFLQRDNPRSIGAGTQWCSTKSNRYCYSALKQVLGSTGDKETLLGLVYSFSSDLNHEKVRSGNWAS